MVTCWNLLLEWECGVSYIGNFILTGLPAVNLVYQFRVNTKNLFAWWYFRYWNSHALEPKPPYWICWQLHTIYTVLLTKLRLKKSHPWINKFRHVCSIFTLSYSYEHIKVITVHVNINVINLHEISQYSYSGSNSENENVWSAVKNMHTRNFC